MSNYTCNLDQQFNDSEIIKLYKPRSAISRQTVNREIEIDGHCSNEFIGMKQSDWL